MRRLVIVALAGLAVLTAPAPALRAQDSLEIVAVVNDDAISKVDLIVRLQLAIRSTGLKDTPEVRARLAQQVLHGLIDERLKRDEARRLGVTATEDEVVQALTRLARQNGMTIEQLNDAVRQDPVVKQAFVDEAQANIAWEKLVRTKLGPTVNVTEQDLDDEMRRIAENQGKPQYLIAEIFLSVDQPDQDAAVRQTADRLMEQLRQGTQFERIAAQFSQSTTASRGGLVGWVRPDQLDEELASAITSMQPGQVDGPIRGAGGYYILDLLKVRQGGVADPDDTVVTLKQIFISAPSSLPKAQIDEAMAKVQGIRARVKNCDDMDKVGSEYMPANAIDLGKAKIADLPNELKELGRSQPIGQISNPIEVDTGIGVFMICSRTAPPNSTPNRDAVYRALVLQRLDSLALGYLRDIRRAAIIDIRNFTF